MSKQVLDLSAWPGSILVSTTRLFSSFLALASATALLAACSSAPAPKPSASTSSSSSTTSPEPTVQLQQPHPKQDEVLLIAQGLLPDFANAGADRLTGAERKIAFAAPAKGKTHQIAIACIGAEGMMVTIQDDAGKVLAPARRTPCSGGVTLTLPAGKGNMVAVAKPVIPTPEVFIGWAVP